MKTLKFSHPQVKPIVTRQQTSTWRISDDKNLSIDDVIECIDNQTGKAFGVATVNHVSVRRLSEIDRDSEAYLTIHRHYKHLEPSMHVKLIEFSFEPYPTQRSVAGKPTFMQLDEVKLYGDGGSRGNPGPSSSGFVILDMSDNVVKKSGIYLGITTNNQAEYNALKVGLEECRSMGAKVVHVYMDSLLVINQMKGIFRVKNKELFPVHESIRGIASSFDQITYQHVPRELNKLADQEVNDILDAELNK
jgi:ribonuclease HI